SVPPRLRGGCLLLRILERAHVADRLAGTADGARLAALIGELAGALAAAGLGRIRRVDRGATGEQRHGLRRTAVVGQWSELWILTGQIAGQRTFDFAAVGILDEIEADRQQRAAAVRGFAAEVAIAGDDRVGDGRG